MFSAQSLKLLLVALSVLFAAQALRLDAGIAGRNRDWLGKRQISVSLPTVQATSTSSTPPPTSTKPPPTSSTPPPTSSQPPPTSSTPTTTSSTPTTTPTDRTTSSTPLSTSTIIVTTTAADGSPTVVTSESVTTPTLSSQSGGGTSGMSETTRNTIIGVVVGVGGAIILGVIALVAWRIWGRKKTPDENDGMLNYGGGYTPAAEKVEPASTSSRTPFQSTLESYHAPTQVNTASNF